MTKVERYFYWITIAVLAVWILLMQTCKPKQKGFTLAERDILKIEIPKTKWFPKYVPVPYEVKVPGPAFYDTIPYTDSNYCKQLAKEHYSEKLYNDTLKTDTIEVYVQETVKANSITNRLIGYKLLKPFVTLADDRFQVFIAGNLGTDLKGFVAGPELILKPKNNYLFKIGADFNTTGTVTYRVGFGFLIRFKKKLK